jgi:hypothetical protein
MIGNPTLPRVASLATAALQLIQDLRFYILPRSALRGIGLIGPDSLFEHLAMPIGYRNLFRPGSDPIPERLNVIDLLVDRELIESRGRDR